MFLGVPFNIVPVTYDGYRAGFADLNRSFTGGHICNNHLEQCEFTIDREQTVPK
jgi:hypothetical protein